MYNYSEYGSFMNKLSTTFLKQKMLALSQEVYELLLGIGELGDELNINVYIVGGIVRDIFLNTIPSNNIDIDIVVEDNSYFFAQKLSEKLCVHVHTYTKFLTAVIFYHTKHNAINLCIDIASARSEFYSYPTALPIINYSTSIEHDLFRRDFTINAMAIQLNKKAFSKLFDIFNAQQDIQNKVIKVLHTSSFINDPTRIIRAVRFEQRFCFQISKYNEELIKEALSAGVIKQTIGKRFAHEFLLIFKEVSPLNCLLRMDSLDVLASIDSRLKLTLKGKKALYQTQKILDWYNSLYLNERLPCVASIYLLVLSRLYTHSETKRLFKNIGLSLGFQETLLGLKLKSQELLKKLNLIFYQSKGDKKLKNSSLYTLFKSFPLESLFYIASCTHNKKICNVIQQFIHVWRFIKLDITGYDLKLMGFLPGPQYSRILQDVFKQKIDGNIQSRKEQLAYIQSMYI